MPNAPRWRVSVLVSGSGSNLEALLSARQDGQLPGVDFVQVISSRGDAVALQRAARFGVPGRVIERAGFPDEAAFEAAHLAALAEARTDLVCLAGYLRRLGPRLIDRYRGRILNIHPALLPRFGGAGMYGRHVHEAVLRAGVAESGCTVHLVDEEFDHGDILAQARVPVLPGDTPDALAARVLAQEHRLYPETLRALCEKLQRGEKPITS